MAGEVNLAARRLEVALKLAPHDVAMRRDLIRLHERASRKIDAANELMRLADVQSQGGDVEGMRESLERAGVLAPDDLDIMERVFRFHEARGDTVATRKTGERLASALVAQELFEDAIPLFERLVVANEECLGLRESFANCLVRAGEHGKAVQHLLIVAEHRFVRGDFPGARGGYRRVLTVAPECEEAQARIEEIDSGAAEDRVRRRQSRRRIAVAFAFVALFAWQAAREWSAQTALHEVARMARA
jgi:tetratricopeptide (TPR) repeat protein